MTLLTLVVIGMNIGCEDRIDSPVVNTPEGEPMTVTLNVDLADEADGASLYPNASTKADKGEAFSAQLLPTAHTKADVKPTSLHNLEIRQYNYNTGAYMGGQTIGTTTIGAPLTLTLNASEQCRLVIIARGEGNTVQELGKKTFSEVQSVLADTATIKSISTEGTDMNKMPYILYLPNVKVADHKIQSPDGTDVRLRLKRLAVKLSLNWTFGEDMTNKGYVLKEVRLFQVPADYRILPAPESTTKWGTVYPSSVSNFIDGFRLKGDELTSANGTRTIWMPANAQGSSSAIVSPNLRSKRRVNPATTYAEFVVDNADKEERFYYRVYLGGNTTTDFNLFENTDYNWSVNINSVKYTTDDRISMLDQTPVISNNLQPTANCFMMQPGTNICFNPYKHEAGTNGWNTYLTNESGSINTDKEITKIKVLWQTKDAGTSGDLVLGYIVDDTNHQNLVNLTDGSSSKNARVHIKVSNTNGGNAVIAAYNNNETIVWSWHIWISDYVPTRINHFSEYESAQQSSINGTVHKYDSPLFQSGGVYADKVMMDRDLGARKGGFPSITIGNSFTTMDVVNTFGMLYQCGRKDPFFPSADGTNNETDIIYDGDGLAIGVDKTNARATMQAAIANPLKFYYYPGAIWNTESDRDRFWNAEGGLAPGKKTIYDPCPKGWKVPNIFVNNTTDIENSSIYTNFCHKTANEYDKFLYYYNDSWHGSVSNEIEGNPKGGRLFLIGNTTLNSTTIHNSVWIPAGAERNGSTEEESYKGNLSFAGKYGHLWGAESTGGKGYFLEFRPGSVSIYTYYSAYGWSIRCIQQ